MSSQVDERPVPLLTQLTPAERLVAVHVVEGLSCKEIATLLGKSTPTIKNQISSILQRTHIDTRFRFIAAYYRQLYAPSAESSFGSARGRQS
ncbi:helix-turn-helix transcriptional regulator [Oleiharenicola lentus]|uniref:helix-turn-helix transcriptional regulator n=1 Tax=Oleiharenicola lentus TaxID=2508720 RepID=UPI003F66C6BE